MASATEIWNYRSLTANLARREMRAQYKKSILGSLWSLINPLSVLLIYALVFGTFLRIEPPVAGNGAINRTGLDGYSCAAADVASSSKSNVSRFIPSPLLLYTRP